MAVSTPFSRLLRLRFGSFLRSARLLFRRLGRLCPLRRQRIVPVLGEDLQTGPLHAHLDVAEGTGGLLRRVVAQGVLITSFHGYPLISALDRLFGDLVQNIAAGRIGVPRKDVAVAEAGN